MAARTSLNRAGVLGQGALSNAVEGTLRQTRRTLTPAGGTNLSGIIFFSMATSNIAVTGNPFSIPPANTPVRPFAEFASGLSTGKSVDGLTLYEPAGMAPIFNDPALIPGFSWKLAPVVGHMKGEARHADDTLLDTATVTIENLETHATKTTKTDGGGFFGAVDLAPGTYRAQVESFYYCFNVTPGLVASATRDNFAPETTAALAPAAPDGQNGWFKTKPTVSLRAADNCSGVALTEYSTDGGATWQPYSGGFVVQNDGITTILYRSTDLASNAETAQSLTVNVDTIAPALSLTATPSEIWPPNGRTVKVVINGTGADSTSGLASVSYVVTDEYDLSLSIPSRTLSGNSGQWRESLGVEAHRKDSDTDGRLYVVVATITDLAGNTANVSTNILVPHDQGKP